MAVFYRVAFSNTMKMTTFETGFLYPYLCLSCKTSDMLSSSAEYVTCVILNLLTLRFSVKFI